LLPWRVTLGGTRRGDDVDPDELEAAVCRLRALRGGWVLRYAPELTRRVRILLTER
jgi:hypothetical protein